MTTTLSIRRSLWLALTVAAILAASLLLIPRPAASQDAAWLDRLTAFVTFEDVHAASGNFGPYYEQLSRVRAALQAGDHPRVFAAMNRLMDMLEAREGGIAPQAAEAIWTFCEQVTPAAFHDINRHLRGRHRAAAGGPAARIAAT